MVKLLRNLSINVASIGGILGWVIMFGAIAALGVAGARMADSSIGFLNNINVSQLNEIGRADSLLNQARLSLEAAASYIESDRAIQAERRLEESLAMLDEADNRFGNFLSAEKTPAGQALADELGTNFQDVISLVREQHEALVDADVEEFGFIREELMPLNDALARGMEAFVEHAESSIVEQLIAYDGQINIFTTVGGLLLMVVMAVLVLMYYSLRKMIIEPMNQAVLSLDYISRADLSHDIDDMGRNEIGQLFIAMKKMQDSLSGIVRDVRNSSDSIHIGASEIAGGNADLSSRTEQQAASLEETAASMEQLTATVKQNADNARQASTLAQDASVTASDGGQVVDKVITTMRDISDSSRKIADITGLIDSIAFQTNILALNASVEAARAGEQGRGFAVVAGEVRNLAGRSAEAAKQIKQLIESSVQQVSNGSKLVEDAGATMKEVVASVKRVTDIMDEISAASQEQSGGIEQVSQAVSQMDAVTQQNATLVQETAAAASSLEDQARRLEQVVAVFRLSSGEQGGETKPVIPVSSEDGVKLEIPVAQHSHEVKAFKPQVAKGGDRHDTKKSEKTRQSRAKKGVDEAEWEVF